MFNGYACEGICPRTPHAQCHWPQTGLEPRLLDVESSELTKRPL